MLRAREGHNPPPGSRLSCTRLPGPQSRGNRRSHNRQPTSQHAISQPGRERDSSPRPFPDLYRSRGRDRYVPYYGQNRSHREQRVNKRAADNDHQAERSHHVYRTIASPIRPLDPRNTKDPTQEDVSVAEEGGITLKLLNDNEPDVLRHLDPHEIKHWSPRSTATANISQAIISEEDKHLDDLKDTLDGQRADNILRVEGEPACLPYFPFNVQRAVWVYALGTTETSGFEFSKLYLPHIADLFSWDFSTQVEISENFPKISQGSDFH